MEGAPAGEDDPARLLTLAFGLCARMCHDLAGSAGAVAGMLEIAAEAPDAEALEIALAGARALAAKLRLMRAAWGLDEEVPEIGTLIAGLPGAERLRVEIGDGIRALPAEFQKLAVNFLVLAAQALPRGGAINLDHADGALSVTIEGTRAGWPAALNRCLSDRNAVSEASGHPRDVSIAVLCLFAQQHGVRLEEDGTLRLTARRIGPG